MRVHKRLAFSHSFRLASTKKKNASSHSKGEKGAAKSFSTKLFPHLAHVVSVAANVTVNKSVSCLQALSRKKRTGQPSDASHGWQNRQGRTCSSAIATADRKLSQSQTQRHSLQLQSNRRSLPWRLFISKRWLCCCQSLIGSRCHEAFQSRKFSIEPAGVQI